MAKFYYKYKREKGYGFVFYCSPLSGFKMRFSVWISWSSREKKGRRTAHVVSEKE